MRWGRVGLFAVAIVLLLWFGELANTDSNKGETDGIRYLIGVSQPNLSDPWQVAMNDEIKEAVAGRDDIKIIFTDAATDSARQSEDVRKLLGYGIDLLIISLDDPTALTPVISEAYNDIPVIVLGRGVSGYDYTVYIGPDNEWIGRKAGEFALETLGSDGGSIVEIQGISGSPGVQERSAGFNEAIGSQPNMNIVASLSGDWQRDRTEDLLTELLRENRAIDLVFAHSEAMAHGAEKALRAAGLHTVDIIGIDGVNIMKQGNALAPEQTWRWTGMLSSPTGGREAIHYAMDILNKAKGIPKKVILRSATFTQDGTPYGFDPDWMGDIARSKAGRDIVVGFAQVGSESSWRIAHTKSVINAAAEAGIELLYENAEDSQERQLAIVERFIEREVDAIIVSPKTETGWEDVFRKARDAGIPIILSDREVKTVDDTLWTTYIGSDFVEEGRRAAAWLVEETAGAGSRYNVIEIQGVPESAPAIGRKQGFDEGIEGADHLHVLASLSGDFNYRSGKRLMEEALRQYGADIDFVYAHNDDMALGAIEAIESYGLRAGSDIRLISVDATIQAFRAMSVGKLDFVVECNPLLGPQMMKAIRDMMDGKEPPMKIITSESVFPAETAKQEMPNREY